MCVFQDQGHSHISGEISVTELSTFNTDIIQFPNTVLSPRSDSSGFPSDVRYSVSSGPGPSPEPFIAPGGSVSVLTEPEHFLAFRCLS